MGRWRHLIGAALLVGVLVFVGCGGDDEDESPDARVDDAPEVVDGVLEPEVALDLAKESGVIPASIPSAPGAGEGDTQDPLSEQGDWYLARETGSEIARDQSGRLRLPLRRSYVATAAPAKVSEHASEPLLVIEDTALFMANTFPSTDILFTQSQLGIDQVLIVRGPTAPESYSWSIASTDPGVELTQRPGEPLGLKRSFGGGDNSRFVSGYTFPLTIEIPRGLAVDSARTPNQPQGRPVRAKLSVAAPDRLVLSVDHRGQDLEYPLFVVVSWNNKKF